MFKPDWKSPPGDTIMDLLEERNWSIDTLAFYLGFNRVLINQLLNGELLIDETLGVKLSILLGSSPEFWINRYRQYKT